MKKQNDATLPVLLECLMQCRNTCVAGKLYQIKQTMKIAISVLKMELNA